MKKAVNVYIILQNNNKYITYLLLRDDLAKDIKILFLTKNILQVLNNIFITNMNL